MVVNQGRHFPRRHRARPEGKGTCITVIAYCGSRFARHISFLVSLLFTIGHKSHLSMCSSASNSDRCIQLLGIPCFGALTLTAAAAISTAATPGHEEVVGGEAFGAEEAERRGRGTVGLLFDGQRLAPTAGTPRRGDDVDKKEESLLVGTLTTAADTRDALFESEVDAEADSSSRSTDTASTAVTAAATGFDGGHGVTQMGGDTSSRGTTELSLAEVASERGRESEERQRRLRQGSQQQQSHQQQPSRRATDAAATDVNHSASGDGRNIPSPHSGIKAPIGEQDFEDSQSSSGGTSSLTSEDDNDSINNNDDRKRISDKSGTDNDHKTHKKHKKHGRSKTSEDKSGHEGDNELVSGLSMPSNGGPTAGAGGEEEGSVGMVKFMLAAKAESFMAGETMRNYLNRLVEESVAATRNQTCNIAFVKTHKTASTTAATIFYRYGKRHKLNVANFYGHNSSIKLPEAVRQVQESGELVDLMHYHHAWDGFFDGNWSDAKAAYKMLLRDPEDIKLVTVVREPVSHYLSYYYYFLQPQNGLSIGEYFQLASETDDPSNQASLGKDKKRRAALAKWHGHEILDNPLCAEFGIHNTEQLEVFIRNDLPDFAMILLTNKFEEGLAIFMRMFNWRPIDMTYRRVVETKAGVARFDGKELSDVPKIRDLPPQVLAKIKSQTQLDQILYKAAVKIYLEKRVQYEGNLEVDMGRIRTVQSAVHGYLNFDADSPAHKWYEGNVKCFEDPSPVQPF